MGIIKKIKAKKRQALKRLAVRWGIMLFGVNSVLALLLFFGANALGAVTGVVPSNSPLGGFIVLLLFFAFAAIGALVWFRVGSMLRLVFKQQPLVWTGVSVAISVVATFALAFWLMAVFSVITIITAFASQLISALLIVGVLSAIFEFVIVGLGVITRR